MLGLSGIALFAWLLYIHLDAQARSATAIHEQRELLRATLTSIGDAVIATDAAGNVTLLNTVARNLTGWSEDEARGQPLSDVFRIVNEETRQAVVNPASAPARRQDRRAGQSHGAHR